jgi:hypothetical protein
MSSLGVVLPLQGFFVIIVFSADFAGGPRISPEIAKVELNG